MRTVSKSAIRTRWQLQEAKNKLSEVIRRALRDGPQTITVRGVDTVIVSPVRKKRVGRARNMYELLKPLRGSELKMERHSSAHREVNFEDVE